MVEHPRIPTVAPETGGERDLTNVYEIRKLLSTHNMRPHKSFGQNFLIDRSVLQTIVNAAEINPDDEILEVGAGTGVLTQELARHAKRVVAVEVERDMLVLLKETTSSYP
ncbi:MAG TPA: rRNA adenine N-6-methyltransferase family protein, partial [Candidatus Nitrosopolaris rasttigaisensis]|nr:rRNA adenine N-6-methyltransferase family protein [Candidatus Nitrosopolaris rasttigaisensis]